MKDRLKEELFPLYEKLVNRVPDAQKENYAAFCMQWGKQFPSNPNEGILFVGRATNGWHYSALDPKRIFSEDPDLRVFNRENQMEWADGYVHKSAFWRVIKAVSQQNHAEPWYDHIAWSNLCKIAPEIEGNPSNSMYYDHLELNCAILKTEITILSPKVVVMLTKMNWAVDYLKYLNKGVIPALVATENWGNYQAQLYDIGNCFVVVSEHPMGKKESLHTEAIQRLINIACEKHI